MQIYKCKEEGCGKLFVVMKTSNNSLLPVETEEPTPYTEDDVFNYRKHKSHLLNCESLRNKWEKIKKKLLEIETIELNITNREMMK